MTCTKKTPFFPVVLSPCPSAYGRCTAVTTYHVHTEHPPLFLAWQPVDCSAFRRDGRLHNRHLAIWILQQRYFGQWIILLLRLSRFMNKYHQVFCLWRRATSIYYMKSMRVSDLPKSLTQNTIRMQMSSEFPKQVSSTAPSLSLLHF